jgi:site-specific recombinase XerD
VDDWLKGLSPKTSRIYAGAIRTFTVFCRGRDIDPFTITREEIRCYFNGLSGAPKTLATLYYGVRSYYKYLNDIERMDKDPAHLCGYKLPTQNALKAPRALEKWEVKRLIKFCKLPKHAAMIAILFGGGLRVSEVAALERDDVTYIQGVMCLAVRHGKGDKYRRVPLPAGAAEHVKVWIRKIPEGQTSLLGLSKGAISAALRNIAKRASLKNISTHCGRVTSITTLYHAGERLEDIVQFTGHSSVATAEKYIRRNPTIFTPNLKLDYF